MLHSLVIISSINICIKLMGNQTELSGLKYLYSGEFPSFYIEKKNLCEGTVAVCEIICIMSGVLSVHVHLCEGGSGWCLYGKWSHETLLMKHNHLQSECSLSYLYLFAIRNSCARFVVTQNQRKVIILDDSKICDRESPSEVFYHDARGIMPQHYSEIKH